jgi:hypothetical protein
MDVDAPQRRESQDCLPQKLSISHHDNQVWGPRAKLINHLRPVDFFGREDRQIIHMRLGFAGTRHEMLVPSARTVGLRYDAHHLGGVHVDEGVEHHR